MTAYQATYQYWLEQTAGNRELHEELLQIQPDEAAIEDRFYRDLEFGTGGLRGVLGAGSNRMNVYTVAKATQGYCNYLQKKFEAPTVAIAYDSRIHSDLFAQTAAGVFAANRVMVHIYPQLMPTPSLSFAVRDLHCSGGIVITASHNPSKYNGYKVYGSDGCQITTQAAREIQTEIDAIDPFTQVQWMDFEEALKQGLAAYIGDDLTARYLQAVSDASVLPADVPRDVSIVYTPLNGAGISCVPRCLEKNGFTSVIIPEEQRTPDGTFPTCPYPNPEVREALQVGLEWARRSKSELLLATDPDCDRVGAAVRQGDGYILISGNEMGVLLLDFICKMRLEAGTMPERPVAVKTIVTTPMAARVAERYQVELRDVLTGFKFIGEQIGLLEQEGHLERYVFGFEESYGYLSGGFVRDKDAVNASLLICEMFAYYKAQGKSLLDVLAQLYEQYGFYESRLLNFTFEGTAGLTQMQERMRVLRENPPRALAGIAVERTVDYEAGGTGLPPSNVIRFYLAGGLEAVARPSGTEPKLKVYLTAVGPSAGESRRIVDQLDAAFTQWAGSGTWAER